MELTITINNENQYLDVVTSGDINKDNSLNMVEQIAFASIKNKIKKILIDHSRIDSVLGEILDVYGRPEEFKGKGVLCGIKVAEVIKPEHKEFFHFLETTCRNRGYQFKMFVDHKSALEWLLGSDSY